MALSTVQLQALRDALVNAIGSGVLELAHEGKTIRYQSIAEMEKAITRIDNEMATVAGTSSTRARQIRMATSKGL